MFKLFVGSLPFRTSESELREMFERFGAVESATIVADRETGRSRGFGFVEMADQESATKAMEELDGSDLDGRTIVVKEAREKERRSPR